MGLLMPLPSPYLLPVLPSNTSSGFTKLFLTNLSNSFPFSLLPEILCWTLQSMESMSELALPP